jgi:hypothetical protein
MAIAISLGGRGYCMRILVALSALVLTVLATIVVQAMSGDSRYNFYYTDGERPWDTHVDTRVNCTLQDILIAHRRLPVEFCDSDTLLVRGDSFYSKSLICLRGDGAKMIASVSDENLKQLVFISPGRGGLLERESKARGAALQFYQPLVQSSSKYFVIPFGDREIPTYTPRKTRFYLPLWRTVFQKVNRMSDEYFAKHIQIMGTSVEKLDGGRTLNERFSVVYYYSVDWARIQCLDMFDWEIQDTCSQSAAEKLLQMNLDSLHMSYGLPHFTVLKLVDHVAVKEQIVRAVRDASPAFEFDVNRDMWLEYGGVLALRLHGTIDEPCNRCIFGTIALEDARILSKGEGPCWID